MPVKRKPLEYMGSATVEAALEKIKLEARYGV